ncbi:MAG: hypothetical protein GXO48_01340 [Chlorobi bacterium]|nr:hypothetical protein [Chlorobiota bacterium]
MKKFFNTLPAIAISTLFLSLIVFHACKKEKIIIQGSRTDTIYIQYEHCQYDTSLPINCYTTHLRSSAQRLGNAQEDTIVWYESQCITLGHCKFDEFYPYYKVCLISIVPGRIPDTAMCRAAGIPLCCPEFIDYYGDDVVVPNIDIAMVMMGINNICNKNSRLIGFDVLGQTSYLEHPDSNPNFSCQNHLQSWSIFPDFIQRYQFKNCSIRLIEYPKKFDYDTVTVVYAMQGPNGNFTPCCAGSFSTGIDIFSIHAKIGLQCQ